MVPEGGSVAECLQERIAGEDLPLGIGHHTAGASKLYLTQVLE